MAAVVKRIKTGIPGLDGLMEGGLVQGSSYLVTGGTGTGKTTFACQFLWQGLQQGDSVVYITLEEDPQDIKEDAILFGWDFAPFEKKGLCKIIYHDPAQVNNLGTIMMNEIAALKAKRLVIDSTAVMGLTMDTHSQVRRRIYSLINALKGQIGRASCRERV